MIPTALFVVALALPSPQQVAPEEFATKQAQGITLNYSVDLAPADADGLMSSLVITRDVLREGLGIALTNDPVVQVRIRKDARKAYYTDGEDKIFFDFPTPMMLVRLQQGDERILRYSEPAFLQLWLMHTVSSTAGLDRRVLLSLIEYADWFRAQHTAKLMKTDAPPAPTGPGRTWYELERVYPGTTTFVLNNLSSRKVAAHLLGQAMREAAISATEDPQVAHLFDGITPPEPILAPEELKPGPLAVPTLPLRPGRLALFNGTPILDTEGAEITVGDRIQDFENVFDMLALSLPAASIQNNPPAVRGIELWPLYFEFRPRILRARDNIDYYLVLREFLGRFGDRAIALRPTPALPVTPGSPVWSSVFGLGFTRVGDHIFVTRVTPDSEPAKADLTPGLEVVTVDGRPALRVHDMLTDVVETFDSCPSTRRAEAVALDCLLTGAQGSQCTIEVADRSGEPARTLHFTRGLPPPPRPIPFTVEVQMRPGDQVGVITVHHFGNDALQRFAAALDELTKQGAKAIVIDVRGNEGTRDPKSPVAVSLAMLSRLLPAGSGKVVVGFAVTRDRARFDAVQSKEIVVAPAPGATQIDVPIALLTDAWTGGEAEVFALGFQLAKRGIVVGGATAGNVTTPLEAPSGPSLSRSRLEVSIGVTTVVRPDNSAVQGVGITPQVPVQADQADLKAGRDTVLERAIAQLLKK